MSLHGMVSTGTTARPRCALGWQTHEGLQTRKQCRRSAWCYAGERTCGQVCAAIPWFLRLAHQPWRSSEGSRKPLSPFLPLPGKFSFNMRSTSICAPTCSKPLSCRSSFTIRRYRCLHVCKRDGYKCLPQVPAKNGQISQSARSWQRTFLRRAQVLKKMQMPSVLLSPRFTPCWLCDVTVSLAIGPSARAPACQ